MKKYGLTFYTNMPTPYQLDFFDQLESFFLLRVVYFTLRENDRQWNLPLSNGKYEAKVLKDNWFAKLLCKRIPSFHFSNSIIFSLIKDANDFIIVNGNYWSPNVVLAVIISKWRGKKVFYFGEPLFPVKSGLKRIIKEALLFPLKYFTDAILAIGINAIKSYRTYGYKKLVYNVPYNINIDLFRSDYMDMQKRAHLQEKLDLKDEVVYLTSGSLIPRKGIDTVIKAFLKISDDNCRLIILGDGPERENLMELAEGNSNIHFVGFCEKNDVPYYFSIASVFVFASWYDGWALVINEALAAGLAIICSDAVGAAADKLEHNKSGLICSPGNVSQFSESMELLKDSLVRNHFRKRSEEIRESISSRYNAKLLYGILQVD